MFASIKLGLVVLAIGHAGLFACLCAADCLPRPHGPDRATAATVSRAKMPAGALSPSILNPRPATSTSLVSATKASSQRASSSKPAKTAEATAADGSTEGKPPSDSSASAPSGPANPSGLLLRRLPRFFRQLNLDDSQRLRIEKIQQQFAERFERLRQQTRELESERDRRLEEVLSPAQQQKLKELQATVVK